MGTKSQGKFHYETSAMTTAAAKEYADSVKFWSVMPYNTADELKIYRRSPHFARAVPVLHFHTST